MSVEIGNPISLCWGPTPTCIACRISFRNSLYWAPPQLAHYCKLTFRQLLCWPHCYKLIFNSVDGCQYNIVKPRTLIYPRLPLFSY
ncbi:hypothetical protein SA0515718_01316 [Staphylococcus aureus]|nr:hypothetical protein SA0515718_01316 [Staphylococcus aureus]